MLFPGRVLAVAFLATACVAACGRKQEGSNRVRTVGSLTGQLIPAPDPPSVGLDTDFTVLLSTQGRPLTGAQVSVALMFRSMNQTGPSAVCTPVAPGRYLASGLTTGMNGRWEAVVTVAHPSQPHAQLVFPFVVKK